jgi:hypothetical protein
VTATPPLPEPTLTFVPVPPEILAGEKIAFLQENDLQLINVASRAQFQVSTSDNVTHIFGWSHDGSQLLLGVGEYPILPETDMPGGTDLWALNIGEGKAVQLTHNLEILSAVWSPVNDQIAYHTRVGDLYLINSRGDQKKQLASQVVNDGLAWSPDGSELLYVQLQRPGDLTTMDVVIVSIWGFMLN